jgi:hypothetical protein
MGWVSSHLEIITCICVSTCPLQCGLAGSFSCSEVSQRFPWSHRLHARYLELRSFLAVSHVDLLHLGL